MQTRLKVAEDVDFDVYNAVSSVSVCIIVDLLVVCAYE